MPKQKALEQPLFIVTFFKDLGNHAVPILQREELEWAVFGTFDKQIAIEKAKKLNELPMVNFTTERFRVWQGKTEKFTKAHSQLVFDGKNIL
jgi:hypothetical protein